MSKTQVFTDTYETVDGVRSVANDFLSELAEKGCEIVSVDIRRDVKAYYPYMLVVVYKEEK